MNNFSKYSNRLISIDGTSNAGKTTLCENLLKNVQNIVYIPGVSEYAKIHSDKYPNIPSIPKNANEEIQNQVFFFGIEADRLKEANEIIRTNENAIVVMDRTIIEILSVAYSFSKINEENSEWKEVYKNAAGKCMSAFKRACKKYDILQPGISIFLKASPEIVQERNNKREQERGKKLSDDWVDSELINNQIYYFEHNTISNEFRKRQIIKIDTDFLTEQEVMEEVCKKIGLKIKEKGIEKDD